MNKITKPLWYFGQSVLHSVSIEAGYKALSLLHNIYQNLKEYYYYCVYNALFPAITIYI